MYFFNFDYKRIKVFFQVDFILGNYALKLTFKK